jgi:hypothetical protein
VQRAKDYRRNRRLLIETVLKTALIEEPPPTVKEVAKRAGHRSGQTLRIWFPDLYRALADRASRRREWWLARIRSVLEAMAVEEPPPSGKAAAARAGVAHHHICRLFPDLWRELGARHVTHKKQENARNRHAFQSEVCRVAQELLLAGKYPSRRRVRSLLPESKFRGTHLIVREVQKVVDDFSGRTAAGPAILP